MISISPFGRRLNSEHSGDGLAAVLLKQMFRMFCEPIGLMAPSSLAFQKSTVVEKPSNQDGSYTKPTVITSPSSGFRVALPPLIAFSWVSVWPNEPSATTLVQAGLVERPPPVWVMPLQGSANVSDDANWPPYRSLMVGARNTSA